VTVQPVAALVRLEGHLIENPPHGAAAHRRCRRFVDELRSQLAQRPLGHRDAPLCRLLRGQDQHPMAVLRGESPRPTGTRQILQTVQAEPREATPPFTNRVRMATQLHGHLQVGRIVRLGTARDDPCAKHRRLWRRSCPHDALQLVGLLWGKMDRRGSSHREHSMQQGKSFRDFLTTRFPIKPSPPFSPRPKIPRHRPMNTCETVLLAKTGSYTLCLP